MNAATPSISNPDVAELLEELKKLGAEVTLGKPVTEEEIRAAEEKLGFSLPAEYRELLLEVGGIDVDLERTWLFYGLADALEKTRQYANTFDDHRNDLDDEANDRDAPYYPQKFIVLMDEGDYSNLAEGTVYDAELDAMIDTHGGDYLDKNEAYAVGYWGLLLDKLSDVRDRIADPEDVLVSGGQRDFEKKQKARAALPKDEKRAAAAERLYEVFARYPRMQLARRCSVTMLGECRDCRRNEKALNSMALRELTPKQLSHYAYGYVRMRKADSEDARLRHADYKHFLPRIYELIEDLGNVDTTLKFLVHAFELTTEERAAIDAYLRASARVLPHGWATIVRPVAES